MNRVHIPVLKTEVINFLAVKPDKKYIDTTVGGGGHAEAILKEGGEILGLDLDPKALEIAEKHLVSACPADRCRWRLAHGNFAELKKIAQDEGFYPVSGILFDLGVSSIQLEEKNRGFSFKGEMPLDMRMDPSTQKVTAKDLINGLNEGELYELFTKLGEEHRAWYLARAICRARRIKPIQTGQELAQIILEALPPGVKHGRRHPATKAFQALRIAVNGELNSLQEALPQAVEVLEKKGRLAVISFHSLEDRIVKNFFKEQEGEGRMIVLTKKPIVPNWQERKENPRSRSAKLRVAEKL